MTDIAALSPQALAEAAAAAMWRRDAAARSLGMQLEAISPGSAIPSGCRPSNIASTMSGASSVSRSTRDT